MFVQLSGGSYESRSLIAAAQRSLNLYGEAIPQAQGEPYTFSYLPCPGLTLLSTGPQAMVRCLYTASTNDLYACAGNAIYYIDSSWNWNLIGTLIGSAPSDAAPRFTPVSMTDNGTILLISDGSVDGWTVDLQTRASFARLDSAQTIVIGTVPAPVTTPGTNVFIDSVQVNLSGTTAASTANDINLAAIPNIVASVQTTGLLTGALTITDITGDDLTIGDGTANDALGLTQGITSTGGWYGSPVVTYSDTYFIAVKPATAIFYVSASEAATFDPTQWAAKSAKADNLVSIAVIHRVLFLIGQYTTELWYDSGGGGAGALSVNTFPYEALPGTLFSRGCAAVYSVAQADNQVFWLSQDLAGAASVVMADGYNIQRVSTHAIENAWDQYATISDAVGFTFKMDGHTWYQLSFPTADATWVYDTITGQWHERAWIDANGHEHRHRANCAAFAYGVVVCGDWESGNLYQFDLNNYTDDGLPIRRVRSFPHQIDTDGNRRVFYKQLIANVSVGTGSSGTGSQTVVNTSFIAPDGTLLQNYVGTGDIGSTYTQTVDTNDGQIVDDAFIGTGTGATQYEASGVPLSADYTLNFTALPNSYGSVSTSSIYAIGRANSSDNGYQASVFGDGSQYWVSLTVMGGATTSVAMGTLSSGSFDVSMAIFGTSIAISVQRSQDSLWLAPGATWAAAQIAAISISDTTYTTAGRVLIGGDW